MKQLVDEHLARRYDHGNRIWLLLSAEVWYRRYISRRSEADLEMEISERMAEPDGGGEAPHELETRVGRRSTSRAPGRDTAAQLLLSSYDWESDRETITLGDAIQRFRDVNGYVGLPVPAKPHFLKLFRKLINGSRPPEEIYLVHDASHVLTGTTFTHDEPPLVLAGGRGGGAGALLRVTRGAQGQWAGSCSTVAPSSNALGGSPRSARWVAAFRPASSTGPTTTPGGPG